LISIELAGSRITHFTKLVIVLAVEYNHEWLLMFR
jgi:hypothetical protein